MRVQAPLKLRCENLSDCPGILVRLIYKYYNACIQIKTLLEFESTTSRTRDEHSNHYTKEGVEVNKRLRIPKGQSKMDNP
jgi:hypothetical protein